MKKRKKMISAGVILVAPLGIGCWYLFFGSRITDGSDTEAAAKMIQELTGADLYQIRTERYYRSAFWGTAATAWIEEAFNYPRSDRLENLRYFVYNKR